MANLISSHFGISEKAFNLAGIFDAVIGVDTHLFLDPFLLKRTKIPEFKQSRNKIEKYFEDVIRLLLASRVKGDKAWQAAFKRLIFKEPRGVSIGYGVHSADGSAIGPVLARRLIDTASEILTMGIRDPEIFELIGLFEEGFGADRLSDMTIVIIKDDIYRFTERVAMSLNIKNIVAVNLNSAHYKLPKYPQGNKQLVLLPKKLLRDLPVALTWEGIDHVVAVNSELRARLNKLIGSTWKNKIKKKDLRDLILRNKNNILELLTVYKNSKGSSYDFDNDPAGEVSWYSLGKKFAESNPLSLSTKSIANIVELEEVVSQIIKQFKRNIEINGLKDHLFIKEGFRLKPRHERYSQLLFYAVADSYCEANNLDISREPNAGNGPVDFKVSRGYTGRVLVEIKLSSNNLTKGFEKQIPAYQLSEGTNRSFYVILKVTKSEASIKRLREAYEKAIKANNKVPGIIVIDALTKPTASKR